MVEASAPDNLSDEETKDYTRDTMEPRTSIMVTDPKLFEGEGKAGDIFTEESCLSFTVQDP